MKQTIKTSRVAGQLEKMFRALNNRFFDGELPEVVISLKKTAGAYGHFHWKGLEDRRRTALRNQYKLCQLKSGVRLSRRRFSP